MESVRNTRSTSSSSYSNPKSHRRHYHHHQNPHRHRKDIHNHNVGFADLPYDLLSRIAASFDVPTLRAATTVCRSWRDALRPLREAMVLLRWGKRFKYGSDRARGGLLVGKDPERALDSFMKGAEKGSALAMVDAGLMCWEMGRKEEARRLYKEAAELGHPVAQCNLAISYLEAEHPNPLEAIRWFSLAASSGNPRAEYSLGLCYQNGQGVEINLVEAAMDFRESYKGIDHKKIIDRLLNEPNVVVAKWYLRAAEGGYPRAMYNIYMCYTTGKGLPLSHQHAKVWLKRAANCGHGRAQFEFANQLLQSGQVFTAVVYLELAIRAGEAAALPIKDEILPSLSREVRARALLSADKWRPSRFHS